MQAFEYAIITGHFLVTATVCQLTE